MEKLHILLLDEDNKALDVYSRLCRVVCQNFGFEADIKAYNSNQRLLFDMGDTYFQNTVDILFIEPNSANEAIARTIRNRGYQNVILYLTQLGSLNHALQAFDAEVMNYLAKGKEHLPRFERVLGQAVEKAQELRKERILVRKHSEVRWIKIKDIRYFEAYSDNIVVHYGDGDSFEFLSSLTKLEQELLEGKFLRVHKSYMVAVAFISCISYEALTLDDGTEIPVGRRSWPALKAAVGQETGVKWSS